MHRIPVMYIFIAMIPAFMITVLYYFDHCVSAQLAQQEEFNLVKPPAYHYDLLILSLTVTFRLVTLISQLLTCAFSHFLLITISRNV